MERSIVTGNNSKQKAVSSKQSLPQSRLLTAHCSLLTARGFTLLELMIVISIIIILAAVALPQFNKTIMHARETVLREDLFQFRKAIDQYASDKGKLPQSADDLVSAGYLRSIPVDPITENADWMWVTGEDVYNDSGSGIVDVKSSSSETSTAGTSYSEW